MIYTYVTYLLMSVMYSQENHDSESVGHQCFAAGPVHQVHWNHCHDNVEQPDEHGNVGRRFVAKSRRLENNIRVEKYRVDT